MIKKYYTADLIRDGVIVGSSITSVWFFQSALCACKNIRGAANADGLVTCNFRLVK